MILIFCWQVLTVIPAQLRRLFVLLEVINLVQLQENVYLVLLDSHAQRKEW